MKRMEVHMLREKPERTPQRPSEQLVEAAESAPVALVAARVPTGYDTRINVRIAPNAGLKLTPVPLGCRPRQGAARRDAEPLPLPPGLPEKLAGLDRRVIEWLARDAGNARLFIEQPIEALKRAGVELTRTEEKALVRLSSASRDAALLPPGVRVTALNVVAHPKGRVGSIKATPVQDRIRDLQKGREDDCGDGSSKKE